MSNPLNALWIGKATIKEYQDVTDANTFQTSQSLVNVATNEPCRVSFTREPTTDINTGAATTNQVIMLFIRPDLTIKAGSVIEVTQRGVTTLYKGASTPAIYSNHQEVVLELYEDKA